MLNNLTKKRIAVDIVAGNRLINGQKVGITQTDTPGEALFHVPLKTKKTFTIANVEWEEKGARSGGKAAGGAIAGGILAGPLGAIAGAAFGGRKKDVSTAIITMREIDGDHDFKLHIRCNQKDYDALMQML